MLDHIRPNEPITAREARLLLHSDGSLASLKSLLHAEKALLDQEHRLAILEAQSFSRPFSNQVLAYGDSQRPLWHAWIADGLFLLVGSVMLITVLLKF